MSEFLTSIVWNGELYYPRDNSRYQATYFKPARLDEIQNAWRKTLDLIRCGRAPADIGLYIHWPFCPSHCDFCACSMAVPRNENEMRDGLFSILKELDSFSEIFGGYPLSSLWMGGGTPTFMTDAQLNALFSHIRDSFSFSQKAQIYVEASPATLTDSKLDILVKYGVNRITLGIQSLSDLVIKGANRQGQSREKVLGIFQKLRNFPGLVIDVDMMIGIAGQSRLDFLQDMADVLRFRPHILHVYSFDDRPQVPWSKQGGRVSKQQRGEHEIILTAADRLALRAGYAQQHDDGVHPILYPWEEKQDGGLRKFRASVLGIGPSAISHAFGSAWYTHPPLTQKNDSEVLPFFWMKANIEEEMRGYAIWYLSQTGRLSRRGFLDLFNIDVMETPLAAILNSWEKDGKALINDDFVFLRDMRDLADREVMLKDLYSKEITRALISQWSSEMRAFNHSLPSKAKWREKVFQQNSVPGFRVYHDGRFWRGL